MSGARGPLRALGSVAGLLTRGFHTALDEPRRAQQAVARRILRDHARTELGRHDGIRGPDDLDRLPARTWEELQPWVQRQLDGTPDAVTPWPVRHVEPTSGSQGAHKDILHTGPLLSCFSHLFLVWVADLLRHGPPLRRGRVYLSVSPRFGGPAEGGTTDDTDYLDGWLRPLVSPFLVRPDGAADAPDPESFRRALATGLLATPDLEVLSVWNPSFLGILLDWIRDHRSELLPSLEGPRRQALRADPVDWSQIWPRLSLISCWADGHAALAATRLRQRLPHAMLQPKGLLATEAPVTVPLVGAPAGVPLVDRVWIELLDDRGTLHPLATGEPGQTYEIVVSAIGGLPRYRLGDRVRIVGHHHATPCLELVGRTGGVVDLVGEKLHPDHVARILAEVCPDASFRTLVPVRRPKDGYVLLADRPADPDALDAGLARAHHYRLARELGQLAPPRVIVAPGMASRWPALTAGTARLGDLKDRPLHPRPADEALDLLLADPVMTLTSSKDVTGPTSHA